MPNIEIHGFGRGKHVSDEGMTSRSMLVKALETLPFAGEVVITDCDDLVSDLNGKDQPFIRICSSDESHGSEIIEALEKAGLKVDIEIQPIKKFIPAKK